MRIVIVGGHGQIARLLEPILVDQGHEVVGTVRKEEHAEELRADGVEPAMVDLEDTDLDEMVGFVRGADAVVFAAGGGADGNKERKETVDKGAAILLAEAAEQAGVRRYVMVSSMGTDRIDPDSDDVFQVYLRAKLAADDDVRRRDLDWTVVRPGKLTDDAPVGKVSAGDLEYGEIPRADVAAVLAEVLATPSTAGHTFDVVGGDVSVAEAVAAL